WGDRVSPMSPLLEWRPTRNGSCAPAGQSPAPRTGAFPTTTLVESAGLFGAAPHDLQAPRAAALEQLVGIDLRAPAEEMGLRLVLGRAVDSAPRIRLPGPQGPPPPPP